MIVLGVDIGGTKIATGRVNEHAELLSSAVTPTLASRGYEASIGQIYSAIADNLTPDVEAIGVCAPGPMNPITGVVINPPNLPGWHNIPLADLISSKFKLPCRVENDANAAGLAETLFGAARGKESVFYITLSTGIGTGVILGGKIYRGRTGSAGEGGHLTIDYRSQSVCNCGVPGCIEALASGTALARRGIVPERWSEQVAAGEPGALELLDEVSLMLSAWLGGVISLLDPDMIVIGGGLTKLGEPLFSRLRQLTPGRTINQFAAETPIVPAQLAGDVGVLGAAAVMLAEAASV